MNDLSYWPGPSGRRLTRRALLRVGAIAAAAAMAAPATGCGTKAATPIKASTGVAKSGSSAQALHLTDASVPFQTQDVDYLQVAGKTFQATIYRPDGPGPFPAILDVHGGAWVGDVHRDEHLLIDKQLAAMGMVVAAIDFRQSPQYHYPESVADVNYAVRWLRANAPKFNASSQSVGALGSSSGGHLVLLNGMHPSDPQYAALPLAGVSPDGASPDYIVATYPISDPLARRAYAQQVGNDAPVQSTDIYFSPAGSLETGNPQRILDRHEPVKLPPILLLQGSADANGVVNDKNVSPEIQQRFAASYQAAGGKIQLEMFPGTPHNFLNMPDPGADRAIGLMKTFIGQQLAN